MESRRERWLMLYTHFAHEESAGGEYAPFFLPFFRQSGDEARIYYAMSTWNPYQVVLMKSRLTVPAQSGTDSTHVSQ
jgi:hypothetical protein